jgi:nucleoside-diphosphate-sugar epimerase
MGGIMSDDPMRLFIFGIGYSATALARALAGKALIAGTVREPDKAARLKAEGIGALVFDGTKPGEAVAETLAAATHVLVSLPPGETGDPALVHHAADIRAAAGLRALVYLSTVGVYGDYGGAWVGERTTPHPAEGRSTRRLAAERAWGELAEACGVPLACLRIAGIYGPGRNALAGLAAGTARRIVKPGQVFNRIHVDDIVAVAAAALSSRAAGIFNLADDEPGPGEDPVTFAASLMGVAPPPELPFAEAGLPPMALSFYRENKRVRNDRIKTELGIRLRHPTYRDGLSAMWREGTWKG